MENRPAPLGQNVMDTMDEESPKPSQSGNDTDHSLNQHCDDLDKNEISSDRDDSVEPQTKIISDDCLNEVNNNEKMIPVVLIQQASPDNDIAQNNSAASAEINRSTSSNDIIDENESFNRNDVPNYETGDMKKDVLADICQQQQDGVSSPVVAGDNEVS